MSDKIPDSISLPEIGFVRLSQVLHFIPYKKSTWWAGVRSGRFPKPLKLSVHCTVWKAEDIRQLIKELGEQQPFKN